MTTTAIPSPSSGLACWSEQTPEAHRGSQIERTGRAAGRRLQPPLLSCEAVVPETCLLLKRSGCDPGFAVRLIERGVCNCHSHSKSKLAP